MSCVGIILTLLMLKIFEKHIDEVHCGITSTNPVAHHVAARSRLVIFAAEVRNTFTLETDLAGGAILSNSGTYF